MRWSSIGGAAMGIKTAYKAEDSLGKQSREYDHRCVDVTTS